MAERIYPTTKPLLPTTNTNTTTNPASKALPYGGTRPAYRPHQPSRKSGRGCCCLCFIWTTVIILTLILLAGIFAAVIYFMYHPQRPTFSVSGLQVATLNLTSTSQLITNINVNVTARNPNKKLVFTYNPMSVTLTTNDNDNVVLGNGVIPSFVHGKKNTTMLGISLDSNNNQALDDANASKLRNEMKSKNGVPMKLEVDTKVKVKMGVFKSPKLGIRVHCDGINGYVPSGKSPSSASVSTAKCQVDLRFKIWRWTL